MATWQEVLTHLVHNTEEHFDRLKYRLAYSLGLPDPIQIVPYRGYGSPQTLYLRGRVLEDQGIGAAMQNDSLWDNLLNTYRRLQSDEVPFARLAVRFQGAEQQVVADEEGMFEAWIVPTQPLPAGQLWHPVELELLKPLSGKQEGPVKATGFVMVPPEDARFGVISDLDDTVIQSNVAHLIHMARTVFLGNALTRLPFPGVAALYRALHAGAEGNAANPLFYVSSTLWNLYDLLIQFFELQGIPVGPLLLRNWGINEDELFPLAHGKHKQENIRKILDMYPTLPFILIGDSGEADPEIYQEAIGDYPGRILAVYIRNVSRDLARPEAIRTLAEKVTEQGSTLLLADNSLTIAEHAVERGWIAPQALADVAATKQQDQAPPTPLEQLLGEPAPSEGPTVNVEPAKGEQVKDALDVGDKRTQGPPSVIVEGDKDKEVHE